MDTALDDPELPILDILALSPIPVFCHGFFMGGDVKDFFQQVLQHRLRDNPFTGQKPLFPEFLDLLVGGLWISALRGCSQEGLLYHIDSSPESVGGIRACMDDR